MYHVPEFIEAENFPSDSLDLSSVDFLLQGAMQQTCIVKTRDIDYLKHILLPYCLINQDN